jgi:hypothetical protein
MTKIKIVWMDDQVKTFNVMDHPPLVRDGQLTLSVVDETRQDRLEGRQPRSEPRTVRYPLANIRWWGDPGKEIAW